MIYELEKLNKYINQDLNELLIKATNNELDDFDYWVSDLKKEIERVKKTFMNAAFGSQNDKQIERYIEFHQVELIKLTNDLNEHIQSESDNELTAFLNQFIEPALLLLKSLLTYVENHFSSYFNVDATIPQSYQQLAIHDFQERLKFFDQLLRTRKNEHNLFQAIIYPIQNLIRNKEKTELSFRKLTYFKKLLNELADFLQSSTYGEDHGAQLIRAMIYMNFNSYKFFAYCTEQFISLYQEKETLTDQLDSLALMAKMINQTQEKPGVAYQPQRDSLKHTLSSWIDEEVNFLMKRHQLTLNMNVPKTNIPHDFKLNTSLSVAQLGCLVRLLIEEKVIVNRNQREVLKFFAQHTRTKKAENVSPESLRTRYYNVDTTTKEAVKDVVISLLNNIRKN